MQGKDGTTKLDEHYAIEKIIRKSIVGFCLFAIVLMGIIIFTQETVQPLDWMEFVWGEESLGQTVEITVVGAYEEIGITPSFVMEDGTASMVIEEYTIVKTLIVIFQMMIAIYFFTFALLVKKSMRKTYIAIGQMVLWSALWIFMEGSIVVILTGRLEFVIYVAVVCARLMPVIFLSFINKCSHITSKYHVLLERICYAYLLVATLIFGISGFNIQLAYIMNNTMAVILCVSYMLLTGKFIVKEWGSQQIRKEALALASLAIVAGVLVDSVSYMLQAYSMIGNGLGVGFIAFVMILIVCDNREKLELGNRNESMESEVKQMHTTVLLRQIKAHFLYNTLNSISVLCKQDPKEADRAVKLFASYMRSNMYLIDQEGLIPFEKELDLIHSYLGIEKIRFQEHLTIELDIAIRNFKIPALSIQPIIENAVLHGIGQKRFGGTVIIKTRKEDENAVITIKDDGVGMEISALDKGESLGLKNIQNRLRLMAEAEVHVVSEKGVGTQITVRIPLDNQVQRNATEVQNTAKETSVGI